MENFTEQQALTILINAAKVAQGKGAFSLEEAEIIAKAIKVFVKEPVKEPVPESTEAEAQTAE